jgi:hypothetical protein
VRLHKRPGGIKPQGQVNSFESDAALLELQGNGVEEVRGGDVFGVVAGQGAALLGMG